MKKRIISSILAVCMLVAVLSVSSGAVTVFAAPAASNPTFNTGDAGYAEVDLTTASPVLTNMEVGQWLRATNSSISFGAAPNGDPCWVLNTGDANVYVGLYLRMTEAFYEGYQNETLIMEVEYYKTEETKFLTKYEHADGYEANAPEEVNTAAIGAAADGWNTYTATLAGGVAYVDTRDYTVAEGLFPANNHNLKYTISLTTCDSNYAFSSGNVYIRNIKVTAMEGSPVQSSVGIGDNVGLMFMNDEKIDIPLSLKNTTEETQTVDVSVSLKNYDGETLHQELKTNLSIDAGRIYEMNMDYSSAAAYGTYSLEVEIRDPATGIIIESKTYNFSRILSSDSVMEMLGVATHFGHGRGDYTINLPIAMAAGASWWRDGFFWATMETTKGKYTFPEKWDTWLDYSEANGMNCVAILDYYNTAVYGEIDPTNADWVDGYANHCAAFAKFANGRVGAYELGNEWNHTTVPEQYRDGASYAKAMVKAALAIREADPNAKILTAGTAGYSMNWVNQAMNTSVTVDGKSYKLADLVDGIAYHPYVYHLTPNTPDHEQIADSPAQLASLFPKHEIWITEIGFPTNTGAQGYTEEEAAAYLVQMCADILAEGLVDRVIMYDLQNDGVDASDRENNFGLIRCWQSEEVAYAAKSNYLTMSAMNTLLSGATNGAAADLGENVHAVSFDVNGKKMIVAWSNQGNASVSLNADGQTVKVYDMYGNAQDANIVGGVLSMTVTEQPIYLEMDSINVIEGGITANKTEFSTNPGGVLQVEIVRDNGFEAMEGEYEVDMPYGWKAEGTAFSAGSGKVTDNLQITLPANCKAGEYTITIVPTSGDTSVGIVTLTVTVYNSVEINPSVEIDANGNATYKLEVMVQGSTTGSVKLMSPTDWVSLNETKSYEVEAGEKAYIYFDVPQGLDPRTIYDVTIETSIGGASQKMSKSVTFYHAQKAESGITVDGVIDAEWDGAASITIGESDWLSLNGGEYVGSTATGYTKWDDEYLYIAVVVNEAIHNQTKTESAIWNGDCVQIGIDLNRQVKPNGSLFNEIGFALNSEDNTVYSCMWSSTTGEYDLSGCTFAVVRNEEDGTTVYEAAISWDTVVAGGDISDLDNIGFDFVVNEDAGNGRIGALEFMGGIALNKKAELFGDLVLAEPYTPDVEPTEPTEPIGGESSSFELWWILIIIIPLAGVVVFIVIKGKKKN